MAIEPGRVTRAAVHCEAGEIEVRLSPHGSWQLRLRGEDEREWRIACSGDLDGGAVAPQPAPPPEPLRLGSVFIDTAARRVYVNDTEIQLARFEYDLLIGLAADPNRVFTTEELQRNVLGYETFVPGSRTVNTHASRLRVKLREAGASGFIVNRHNVGYKLWEGTPLTDASASTAA